MTDYIGNYKNRPRRVVFYGRVSTEHEEQLSALGNQMEWYTELALRKGKTASDLLRSGVAQYKQARGFC